MIPLDFDLDDLSAPAPEPVTAPRASVQCLCGRFAKYRGSRSYYNGNYDCYSYTVDCSRCGAVTIECV